MDQLDWEKREDEKIRAQGLVTVFALTALHLELTFFSHKQTLASESPIRMAPRVHEF